MKKEFNVTGMTCAACQANVEKTVKKLSGVESVYVNLLNENMVYILHSNIILQNIFSFLGVLRLAIRDLTC